MYALDNNSGVVVMPEVKNQQFQPNAPRWFTEGGNGVSPSYPGADWFNIVQAELLGVLTEAHIIPDKNNLTQLAQAVKKIIMDNTTTFTALYDLFIGVPIPYPLSTVPTGCLAMNGQRFDTRRYPKLAQKYPSGRLPDIRGEFIRGLDNGRGVDAGREMLSVQSDEIKSHNHKFKYIGQNQRSESNRTDIFNQLTVGDSVYRHDRRDDLIIKVANESDVKYGKTPYNDVSIYINSTGGAETRPRNIAYHYICLAE
ncbi:phage tail protein [Haemophilus haemolyticus]|uniref:phage tail protein n=1 Tax=Haemophilus haemolyticus TaxID=726 RepID=UPI001EFE832C|nr:phage tail protein [Haemophilus haemolyticus]